MTEEEAVRRAADKYRGEGYTVTTNPDPGSLPHPLDARRPAFVAARNGTSVLVEVWGQDRLNELPPVVLPPGWDFDVVVLPRPGPGGAPDGVAATPEFAHSLLAELENMVPRAASQARFLLAWAAAEAALRVAAQRAGIDSAGVSPRELLNDLTSAGVLTRQQLWFLQLQLGTRNRIAHGVPAEGLEPRQADELAGIARSLLAEAPVTAA
jgi:hypothetical protein